MSGAPCPCGSGTTLAACCGRYHRGEPAPTAEALMRSRYTAFVLGDSDYLLASWHPSSRPQRLEPADARTQWLGLKIKRCLKGGEADDEGRVEFVARFREGGRAHRLHETSRFVHEDGRWLYLDGELHGDAG